MVICPRCKRETKGWPLNRPDACSPKDWAFCIRNPETIQEKARVKRENLNTSTNPNHG